jgi:hypothetical protein
MLEHSIQWMNMAQTVVEGLLVCRLLLLRLHRPYLFITLYWLLSVFFDSICWWTGWTTRAALQTGTLEWFFLAFLTPFAAWEAFEEVLPQAAKWRRLALGRFVWSIVLTVIFVLIVSANVPVQNAQGHSAFFMLAGLLCWSCCASASFAFLRSTRRILLAQTIELTRNTSVWTTFFILINALTIVYCLFVLLGPVAGKTASAVTIILLQAFNAAIIIWCIARLKRPAALVDAVSANEEQ